MKKISGRTVVYILISIFILYFTFSSSISAADPDVIIYGNDKCGYCRETIKWLEKQGTSYIYKDVELYGTNQEEMFSKLEKAGFTTTALFPVLDIKGQILMKPKFDDITKALSGNKISTSDAKKIRNTDWRPRKIKSLKTDFAAVKNSLNESDISVYDDGSGSGKVILKQLKKEQIPYKVIQLDKLSNSAFFEMSSRLSALGYGNTILFPVIEVRGEMIMKPSIDDVKILIIEMTAE